MGANLVKSCCEGSGDPILHTSSQNSNEIPLISRTNKQTESPLDQTKDSHENTIKPTVVSNTKMDSSSETKSTTYTQVDTDPEEKEQSNQNIKSGSSLITADYMLFTPFTLGKDLVLKNRIVFSPLTRARADLNTRAPTEINQVYYEQRCGAGLIISEATAISEQGYGWYGSPAIYNDVQVEGWRKVVDRVHRKDGKIFLQLWHMGRQSHPTFHASNEVVSASAIGVTNRTLRNASGESVPFEVPRALELDEIVAIVKDYGKAAERAKQAGFDGVEIHGANGYLIDQFLQSCSNKRTDKYGGSFENRVRFLLEIVEEVTKVYRTDRVGVRIAPNSGYGSMGSEDNFELFKYVCEQLSPLGLAYVAVLDGLGFNYHGSIRPTTAFDVKVAYKGTVIANNCYTRDTAEGVIRAGAADLVGFGRPYIANPDLAERFQNDWPLNPPAERIVFWNNKLGAEGYCDFPSYNIEQ